MKIVIIGYAGSGKSTLSKKMSEKYGLPLLYLDCVHFLPKWEKRSLKQEQEIIDEFLYKNDSWIIDGNYFDLRFEERLKQADNIILFNFNRLSCLFRACKRSIKYKNKIRESMTPDCQEVIDLAFIKHILFDRKNEQEVYKKIITNYKNKLLIINNQKELDKYYKELETL